MKKALNPAPNLTRVRLFKTNLFTMFPINTSVFFVFLIALSLPVFPQQQKIDSLIAVLQTSKSDTSRVKLFHSISIEYLFTKPIQSIEYAKQGLEISEKITYKLGQSICLNALGRAYDQTGEFDKALTCYEKRYEIVKELKDSIEIARVYNNMGNIFFRQAKYKKAIELYEKAIKIFASQKEKSLLAKGYINIGNIYSDQAEYPGALDYYLKAFKIYEETKNKRDIGKVLVNIGTVYMQQKQYKMAKQYILAGKTEDANAKNLQGVGEASYIMALVYNEEGDFENTLMYLNEAYKIFEETNAMFYQSAVIQALGELYRKQGNNEKALEYFNSALTIAKKNGVSNLIAILYQSIGTTYSANGDFLKALEYMHKSEQMFFELNVKHNLLNLSEDFIETFSQTNQPDSVKKYLTKYKHLSESIYNEKVSQSIAEMQTKYDTEKKDKEILTLNLDAEKKKNTIWAIASGFIALFVFSGSGFVLSRNKKKREQAVLLRTISETDMKALRSQMNPHFIFNCIHTINGLLNELKIQESKTCLDKFSSLTRSVLENSKKREIPLSDELETLRLYMDLENMRFANLFQYIFSIDPGIDPETTLLPPLILQPFVENAIKHGFRDPEKLGLLKIGIHTENDSLICTVEDNGVGRNKVNIKIGSGFKKESLGIKLTEERLNLISKTKKTKSYLLIDDLVDANNKPVGTRVKMYMPYELSV